MMLNYKEKIKLREEYLRKKVLNATKWSTISEILGKIITPLTNMILARIISPEAFGVVATITMIMSFADMFTDAGFQKYLVQHEFKDEEEMFENANVAFWTNFLISILLWIFIIIFRKEIAIIVGNPGLGNVIAISCVQLLLTSFSSIQMALYRRRFNFKDLFLIKIIAVFIPVFITIPLSLLGFSYWSIIIGSILVQISNAIVLTIKSKWKPYIFYKIDILKKMISFSIWSLIESISIWLTSWVDVFIISNVLSQHYLGIYKTSTAMVNTIMSLVTASILPVLFSTLSRLQNNTKEFNKMFFTIQKLLSVFLFPLGIGIYLYSDLATKIMLGDKWIEASSIIGIWALTTSVKMVMGDVCSEVYRSKGKPKISFLAQILHLIVLIPTCIIASRYGFLALVYSRALIRLQFVLVHLIIMKFMMKFSIIDIFKNIIPTGVSAIIMGFIGLILKDINDGLLWSFISIAICSIAYFVILYAFPIMRTDMNKILSKLKVKNYKDKLTY